MKYYFCIFFILLNHSSCVLKKDTSTLKKDTKDTLDITLRLMSTFDDTIEIALNNKVLTKNYYHTNESTAACEEILDFKINKNKKNILSFFFYKTNKTEYVELVEPKKYLYVYRFGNWYHQFLDEPLELE